MEWNKLKFEGTSLQDLSLVRQMGNYGLMSDHYTQLK